MQIICCHFWRIKVVMYIIFELRSFCKSFVDSFNELRLSCIFLQEFFFRKKLRYNKKSSTRSFWKLSKAHEQCDTVFWLITVNFGCSWHTKWVNLGYKADLLHVQEILLELSGNWWRPLWVDCDDSYCEVFKWLLH